MTPELTLALTGIVAGIGGLLVLRQANRSAFPGDLLDVAGGLLTVAALLVIVATWWAVR